MDETHVRMRSRSPIAFERPAEDEADVFVRTIIYLFSASTRIQETIYL